ncbi:MAG: sporulation transcriptional regulator SpoIIID [Clostridia bacterium]|nr:sporulation transcriptional regulator SpoIIID [Clostridia bacterium]
MNELVEKRAIEIAEYIVETKCTVRAAAKRFGVSKSTVHKDITSRLSEIDRLLFNDVDKILQINKAQRHIRGGNATKEKYSLKREREKNRTESIKE